MLQRAFRLLFPGSCHLCGRRVHGQLDLCIPCHDELPWLGAACRRCAAPLLLPPGTDAECGRCLASPPPMTRTLAALRYRYPVDVLVRRFKFNRGMAEGRVLADLLADSLAPRIDAPPARIVPVPLHPRRERERGFNQAQWLAHTLARRLGIPLECEAVVRARDTAEQSGLDRAARRRNLRKAFELRRPLPAHVAIVDDVATTGTTLEEVARLLLRHGVERVDAWVLARTPRTR